MIFDLDGVTDKTLNNFLHGAFAADAYPIPNYLILSGHGVHLYYIFEDPVPLFPYIKNERSMLYIGNLTEFVKLMIDNNESGIFYPQNAEYVATSEMVQVIAQAHGKKIRLVKGTTVPLKAMSHVTGLVNKAFGNLSYDMSMSEYKENYRKFSFEESIRQTEVE